TYTLLYPPNSSIFPYTTLFRSTVVLYSGNLGEKQGLEIILEAAQHFRDHKQVHFIVCGSGGARDRLKGMAKKLGLQQLRFYPLRSEEHTSELQSRENIVCRPLL